MSFAVGIGIVAFNRKDILSDTIDQVRAFTREQNAALVVADDGSSDGTLAMLRDKQVPFITGTNMGVVWNKNRALFLLSHMLGCETVILLEDDTRPNRSGWEADWMEAAQRWGHMNYAGDWLAEHFIAGSGTVGDPFDSKVVTAQCASYSSTALTYGGYFDSRFRGYGHGHVEHTRRLVRVGYGGTDRQIDGQECVLYKLIKGDLTVVTSQSHFDTAQERRNLRLALKLMAAQGYRAPWGNDRELLQFRSEIENALSGGTARFQLRARQPAAASEQEPPARGDFSRLFHPA